MQKRAAAWTLEALLGSTGVWGEEARQLGLDPAGPCNIGSLCSDRHVALGRGRETALIWEGSRGEKRSFTFAELSRLSDGFAALLQDLGLVPGDRVALFLDRMPQLYVAFLGILKAGGVVVPLFSAFGPDALAVRLQDAGVRFLLTQQRLLARVRKIRPQVPRLTHLLVVDGETSRRRDGETAWDMDAACGPCRPCGTIWDSPSVLHYTSGTTGAPKGALHRHLSVLSQAATARRVLDLRPGDVYWCTADPGWVTGTSYGIIGPWALGVCQVVLEAGFTARGWYRFLQEHRVSVWYSAPTAIRALMKEGDDLALSYDHASLRHLASVGEPLNAEAVAWSRRIWGRPFHDTYWQTETGAMVVANLPGEEVRDGSMGRPLPGYRVALLDEERLEEQQEPGRVGLIALQPPWPSLFKGYWQNPEATASRFSPQGWYLTGDRASRDAQGRLWFVGRDDDVINTAGHLVGPFEVESALIEHPAVAESAVVGKPDPVNMEVVKAFVLLKPGFAGDEELELELMNHVRRRLSPLAMPQEITFVDDLPRTRSGKILRRVLRAQERGEALGDLSSIESSDEPPGGGKEEA